MEILMERGRATVNDVAELVGVKSMTARHHLSALQADGLASVEEVRQPVGRPHNVYSLTEAGQSLFPQKYHLLVERMIEQLKDTLPTQDVEMFLQQMAESVAGKLHADIYQLPIEEQLVHLVELLGDEGFHAQWERIGDTIRVTEYHCPYYFVGQSHPEVCTIDETIIRIAMGTDVVKSSCLLHGDSTCTFELDATV